jgi:hypothetical protein
MQMAFKFNKNDRKLHASIAEHRVLTVSQLTAIHQKNKQVARRRLGMLEEAGLIQSTTRGFGHIRGRPEKLVSLAENGTRLLGCEDHSLHAVSDRCLDHQLLVNWFRIHLGHIGHVITQLSFRFLSPTSPFLRREHNDRPLIFERIRVENHPGNSIGFTPDGVFSITHKEQKKTLLFFLEVDMGTESVASPKRDPRDIRQKVINYQKYFQSSQYKRYEEIWECSLKGFRLLFLTNTNGRLATLCRLVQEMIPSDFIWLTDQERMFSNGLSAKIWVRGGRQDVRPQSILGAEMACQTPISPLKP